MKQENIYSILLFIAGIAIGSLVTWDITNEPQKATLSIPHITKVSVKTSLINYSCIIAEFKKCT